LLTTGTFYELTKQVIATAGPEDSGFAVQTGKARGRETETDVAGRAIALY
jgi:hypothetical protein